MPTIPESTRYVRRAPDNRLLCAECNFQFGWLAPHGRHGELLAYVLGGFTAGVRDPTSSFGGYHTVRLEDGDALRLERAVKDAYRKYCAAGNPSEAFIARPQGHRYAYQVLGDVAITCPVHGAQLISPTALGLTDRSRGVFGRQLRAIGRSTRQR